MGLDDSARQSIRVNLHCLSRSNFIRFYRGKCVLVRTFTGQHQQTFRSLIFGKNMLYHLSV